MAETGYLAAIRDSYDAVAADYVRLVPKPDAIDPPSRSMLTAFAELVRSAGLGPVADLGCGPGQVTAHLAGLGLSMFGIDLSPKMIMMARQAYPELPYAVGSMTALGLGDGALGGILAWYSTYHTPPDQLPVLFAEFHRTLAPGGYLLLGTYTGDDEQLRPALAFGHHRVFSTGFNLVPPGRIGALLAQAGLSVTAQLESPPPPAARTRRPHACLLARKPGWRSRVVTVSPPDRWSSLPGSSRAGAQPRAKVSAPPRLAAPGIGRWILRRVVIRLMFRYSPSVLQT